MLFRKIHFAVFFAGIALVVSSDDESCKQTMMHTKCSDNGEARLWKKTDTELEDCQLACEEDDRCTFYSHKEMGPDAGDCMGCIGNKEAHTDEHENFVMYPVACKAWKTQKEVEANPDNSYPADYGTCPEMYKDHKCPWQHEDRTHRMENLTIEECFYECVHNPDCQHWSYSREGDANGNFQNVCMGCNATVNRHVHTGFNLYSMCEEGREEAIQLYSAGLASGSNSSTSANTSTSVTQQSSTGTGGGFGDPHLKTWTGELYDFHGECDLVLVKDDDFGNNRGLDLQIRTTIRRDWSFISEVALKIGSDVLEVRSRGEFTLNGVDNFLPAGAKLGDFSIFTQEHSKENKKRMSFHVDLGKDKGSVVIKVFNEFLAAYVKHGKEDEFGNSVGLMGEFGTGRKLARDGTTVINDNVAFGMEWQVGDTDPSLFKLLRGPQFPEKCRMPDPVVQTSLRRRRLDEIGITWEEAKAACSTFPEDAIESCIYDVLSTGDLNMADAGAM